MTYAIRTLAAALVALLAAATAALAADKVRFQTDWIPSGEHAMYYGGWRKGIFAEEGIDITITRGYGSGDTVTKLAGGAADFGVADIAAVLTARARTERAGQDHRRALQPVAAFAVRAQELRHHQLQGARGQEDRHHAGQQPQASISPKVAEKAGTDPNKIVWVNMDAGRDGGAAHRQEHRRRAVLFDPPLLHQQGGEGGRRGDRRRCPSSRSASRSTPPRSSRPTR